MRCNQNVNATSQTGNVLFSTSFVLTVEMSNLHGKYCSKSSSMDRSMQLNTTKQTDVFSDRNTQFESTFVLNKTNPTGFTGMLPRQSSVTSQMNQLFKIPNFDHLPVKKATVRSIKSPRRRVQTGRVKNDLKSSQQSKMSLIPRPSFINSRKSLHGSRNTQLNARKELIKKMVFLAECTLKENKEIKQSTPVKILTRLTPKKTPRSGGYFILPEFQKKVPKVEDIRTPVQEFIKKEMFPYSAKPTPLFEKKNEVSPDKPNEQISISLMVKPIRNDGEDKAEVKNTPERNRRFTEILSHCKTYNAEVRVIHENIRHLDKSFENKLKDLPDYKVYNEFCIYQTKKEELYKELQLLEVDLREFISAHTKVGSKLKAYVQKKEEFFEKELNLHKDFEQAVNSALGRWENGNEQTTAEEIKPKEETPKLRRSLRLSKIKKSKLEERTPMTRKLKKLDSKSKGIQKSGKVRSP